MRKHPFTFALLILLSGATVGLSQFSLLSIGHINNGGRASGLAVSSNYVYLANLQDGFRIYDVSDPSNPVNIFHTNYSGATSADVVISDHYAYLANTVDGLRVYDISDPTNAVEVSHFSNGFNPYSLVVTNGYAYIAAANVFEILNVTNPASPHYIADTLGQNADQLDVYGNYIYLANFDQGLAVYDDSVSINPEFVGKVTTKGPAIWVKFSGTFAYLATLTDGLHIYSVTNPASPVQVGHKATSSAAFGIAVAGNYAYLALSGGIAVYDVSDPTQPILVSSSATSSDAYGIVVSGDYIYVANNSDGLRIFRLIPQVHLAVAPPDSISVTWQTTAAHFALQQSPDLDPASWVAVTNTVTIQGQNNQVTLPRSAGNQVFFRLKAE